MTAYLAAATAVFTFLFLIWNRNDLMNFVFKIVFFGMAGWSAFYLLKGFGFIVAV